MPQESENRNSSYVRVRGVVARFGCSADKVYKLVWRRQIPFYRSGGCLLFKLDELEPLLGLQRVEPVSVPKKGA